MFTFNGIKQARSQKAIPTDNNGVNYVVQSMRNNMYDRNVNRQWLIDNNEPPVAGNAIVLGVTLPAVSYQPNEFGASQVITARAEFLNERIGLFFVIVLRKLCFNLFSYDRKPGIGIYKDLVVELPIKKGKPDFDFMEKFIAELEAERITELEAYLKVSGFDNYELSDDEKQIIEELSSLEWNEFKLGELFYVQTYKKRFDANKVILLDKGQYPYIVRMSGNNGQKGFIEAEEIYLNDGNTLSFGQDTATVFYQEKPYFTGDKIKILKCKYESFCKKNSQFFVAAITRAFSSFSWGNSSYSIDVIEKQNIKLPVKNNQPDFDFMEKFISAVQKLVIKDVASYAERKINTAAKAVGCNQ